MNDLTEDARRRRPRRRSTCLEAAQAHARRARGRRSPMSCGWTRAILVDCLTHLAPRAASPKNEWVKVTPEGLELRERRYFATDEVLNYFKRHAKDWAMREARAASGRAEEAGPAPVPFQPIPAAAGAASAATGVGRAAPTTRVGRRPRTAAVGAPPPPSAAAPNRRRPAAAGGRAPPRPHDAAGVDDAINRRFWLPPSHKMRFS